MKNMFGWEQDDAGVVTLTMDDPGSSANTMNELFQSSLAQTLDRLEAERDGLSGVILTSAKKTFFAGGDITILATIDDSGVEEFGQRVSAMNRNLRRLETLGIPVVSVLNGTALGGGLELALATHRRIAVNGPRVQFGLPEVTLGLLPGGGGVVRVTRMLGIQDGLVKVLLQGTRHAPGAALEIGLIDELADDPAAALAAARAWISEHPDASQPWDRKGFRIPGGTPSSPGLAGLLPAVPANLRKQTKGAPMPAPHHIMCAAVEGSQVDIDTASTIELRYFLDLVRGQTAKNMIQAFWFDLNAINAGGSRPAGHEPRPATKVAVLGAGMMGAGIAYVSAKAGMDVVLKDVSLAAAERGKAYSQAILDKAVARGRSTGAKRDEVLARITPTADPADLAGCDLVVEAVFENTELKHRVLSEAEAHVAPDALLGTNTSTLPITGLAAGVQRAQDVVGIHFFSPVEKMPLVELIRGERTSDAALARALDYVAQIRKTPIVVNDSRGFFTSRNIGFFVNEAMAMLGEGISPSTIEQATTQAGYPVGALQLVDELNMELIAKIGAENRQAAQAEGRTYEQHPGEVVVDRMVAAGRPGKLRGAGFFDYADGRRTGLWSGLADLFPVQGDPAVTDLHEVQERMLFAQAVDAARCLEDDVLVTTADANIGSIMGIGFPPWTGGVIQFVNGYAGGVAGFVQRADELAKTHGSRFTPNELLRSKAAAGERL